MLGYILDESETLFSGTKMGLWVSFFPLNKGLSAITIVFVVLKTQERAKKPAIVKKHLHRGRQRQ
jgi:uncharacterized membrane protein